MPKLFTCSKIDYQKRLNIAVQEYIAQTVIAQNPNFNWGNALEFVGYRKRYIQSHSVRMWKQVEEKVKSITNKLMVNTLAKQEITHEFINAKHIQYMNNAEDAKDLPMATANLKLLGDSIGHYKTGIYDAGDKMQEIDDKLRLAAASIPDSLLLETTKNPELPAKVDGVSYGDKRDEIILKAFSVEKTASQDASGLTGISEPVQLDQPEQIKRPDGEKPPGQ
jgi:hypothetical protein